MVGERENLSSRVNCWREGDVNARREDRDRKERGEKEDLCCCFVMRALTGMDGERAWEREDLLFLVVVRSDSEEEKDDNRKIVRLRE